MKGILVGYIERAKSRRLLLYSEEDMQVDTRAEFLVTVLHEQTNVYMDPTTETVVKYNVNKEINFRLVVQNYSTLP